jgi:hypothetical protein
MSDDRRPSIESADEIPTRPDRPGAVILASAILIVTGGFGLFAALAFSRGLPAGAELVFISTVVIGVASIALGVLIRVGHAWLLAINFAAVLGFLDLLNAGGSPLSLMLGLGDLLVVGLLISRKPWFDAMREWRAARRAQRGTRVSP